MEVVDNFAKPLGYTLIKEEQRKVLCSFVGGEEVFAVLPTGYSKSLCYECLPIIFDSLRTDGLESVIIVISPLVAIIKDQVRKHLLGIIMVVICMFISTSTFNSSKRSTTKLFQTCKVLE